MPTRSFRRWLPVLVLAALLAACGEGGAREPEGAAGDTVAEDAGGPITVYSGRSEELVGPLLEQFTQDTGVAVDVRYGDTAELAATILEEGRNSPADVYFAQDAGALGALSREGMLTALPDDLLERVDGRFTASDGSWVGVSGRARTIIYSTELVAEDEAPDSVLDLTDERWRGRVGWAPTNGSFQSFVTAMRVQRGDERTLEWLEGMVANDVQAYENNTTQVEAAGRGEIEVGLVNHYYLPRFREETGDIAAENRFLTGGDVGAMVNVAGAGILATSDQPDSAAAFVEYLLETEAQEYFAEETFEYPLVAGVDADASLPPLESIDVPELDLGDLDDLQGTLDLLREAGVLS